MKIERQPFAFRGALLRPMIDRPHHLAELERHLEQFPVVGLLGARQVGKTTLARDLLKRRDGPSTVFDLEDPTDRARLADPKLALEPLEGLVVIDEVQHLPELFPLLRVLVDRPKSPVQVGGSWEGFAMAEVVRVLGVSWDRCYFWATHQGAELDLLVMTGGRRLGFEFKRTSAPRATRSMFSALEVLGLDCLYVIYPGETRFPLHERMEALGLLRAMMQGIE